VAEDDRGAERREGARRAPGGAVDRLVTLEEELGRAEREARAEAEKLVEEARERAGELDAELDARLEAEAREIRARVEAELRADLEALEGGAERAEAAWARVQGERLRELGGLVVDRVVRRQLRGALEPEE